MRAALLGLVGTIATAVVVAWANVIAWGLNAAFDDDDPQGLS